MKLGAARNDAGRAWHLVEVVVGAGAAGAKGAKGGLEFACRLKRDALRRACRREGRYLLRSNLDAGASGPAEIWGHCIQLVEIEEAFRNLKGDSC